MAPCVRVDTGERSYRFDPTEVVTIGREPGCDVTLDNPWVSREHADLVADGRHWVFRDHSKHGSFADGHRISQLTVAGEQAIVLGGDDRGARVRVRVEPPRDVFFSYRRVDGGYAGWLHERLTGRFGADALFFDVETIPPGDDFVQQITANIRECRVVLAVIGPGWVQAASGGEGGRLHDARDPVRLELVTALRSPATVLPVFVGGTRMPVEAALPEDVRPLCRRNGVSLALERWDENVARLGDVLDRLLG